MDEGKRQASTQEKGDEKSKEADMKKEKELLRKREKKMAVAKAAEYFKQALQKQRKATKKSEFKVVAELYSSAIELRPSNDRYYFARGNCFRTMGEYQKSFRLFCRTASARGRPCTMRPRSRCESCPAQRNSRTGNRALELDPKNGNFLAEQQRHDSGKYTEAVRDYTSAIRDHKHVYKAYYNRGNCYRKMGRMEDSLSDMRKAVDIEPRNPAGHNNLGLTLFEAGKYDDAVASFTEAVAIDDRNPTFYNNRGLALYHKGDLEAALADLNEAVSRDSSKRPDPNFYFNRGNTRSRHEQKAILDFSEAVRLAPAEARHLHPLRQQMDGEAELALEQFRLALKLDRTTRPQSTTRPHAAPSWTT